MKKFVSLTLCLMLVLLVFTSSAYATTYSFGTFTDGEGYGTKTKVNDNITNLKGERNEDAGMYYGPFSKASTAKLDDGIVEETYVELDLEKLQQGELFEVSLALKNADGDYVSEAVVMSQKSGDAVNVTATWAPKLKAVVKESGIYTYQWKMYKEDDNTYVKFTLIKDGKTVGTSTVIDFDDLKTSDTKNPIAEQKGVSVKYLWFCNIQVADGINVYATLPKTEESKTPETTPAKSKPATSKKSEEKDNTPKTGVVDMIAYASLLAMISIAGIIKLKK